MSKGLVKRVLKVYDKKGLGAAINFVNNTNKEGLSFMEYVELKDYLKLTSGDESIGIVNRCIEQRKLKKEKNVPKGLSDKLSVAILQALRDTELVLKDPNYKLDFGTYHEIDSRYISQFTESDICSVCFAGSVMAKSLGADIKESFVPKDFEKEGKMLKALDHIRGGNIGEALYILKIKLPENLPNYVEVNQGNQKQFFKQMKKISKMLKKEGL